MNQFKRKDEVWKSQHVVSRFLSGVRASIPLAAEQLDVMVQILSADENDVRHFLDFGCGDGVLASVLLDKFPTATCVCLDFSDAMLESARKKLSKYADQVTYLCVDYSDSTYLNNLKKLAPFDAIVSGYSIHHQPDNIKQRLYQEIYSILSNTGFFINIEHVSSPTKWLESRWYDAFISAYAKQQAQINNGKTEEQIRHDLFNDPTWIQEREANRLNSVEQQCDWLRQIGFQNVDCYLKIWELAVFGGQKSSCE